MRILGANTWIDITDGLTGDVHRFLCGQPLSKDIKAYGVKSFIDKSKGRKKKKILNNLHETRLEYGLKYIMMFGPGTLYVPDPSSKDPDPEKRIKELISDQKREGFDPYWKDTLIELAPDLVASVAIVLFEGTGQDSGVELLDGLNDKKDQRGVDPTSSGSSTSGKQSKSTSKGAAPLSDGKNAEGEPGNSSK